MGSARGIERWRRARRLRTATALLLTAGTALADDGLFPLRADDQQPVANFRVPSDIPVDGLPGLVMVGT